MNEKIMVIDDSQMIRLQVRRALAPAGYAIVEAADGVEALEKLAAYPDIRLVVCDVNMPRMSGIEFLEQLSAAGSTTPVVMLTTEGQPDLIQRAKALGAKGWILKPFKAEMLVVTARKFATVAA